MSVLKEVIDTVYIYLNMPLLIKKKKKASFILQISNSSYSP